MPHTGTPPLLVPLYWSSSLPYASAFVLTVYDKETRKFGKESTLWTLEMAAEVSFEEGLTKRRITGETIRATLERMGVRWERAKRWITSPDPEYQRKKAARPVDWPRRGPPRVGRGFLGRDLVQPAGEAFP